MALPINIDDLVNRRKVEGARIEYKAGWNPEKVVHTICAFANDIDNWGGGYIILGVEEENGRPVFPVKGIASSEIDQIQKELLNVCHLIEPLYLPVIESCVYEGKNLLMLWVSGGCERPYKCPEHILKDGKSPKSFYVRKMASTVKASGPDEKALFELSGDVPFDDRPNVHADVADLKMNLLVEFLHEVGSDLAAEAEGMSVSDLAHNMQIATGPVECFKPKNVGLMFFNPHPENFFRCAWIDVVDKPDPTGEGMVEQTFRGPLHVQLRSALDYIRNRFLREKIFKHDDRAEADRFWNYPYRAIEEALANAVYHKSYRIPEPITVVVTPTEMTISSLPGPERSITDEDLKNFHMVGLQYRNRRIGEFLKELDLVEGRNTGIPVILNAMRHNHSPDPVFSTPETRSWLSVVLPIHTAFSKSDGVVSECEGFISQRPTFISQSTGSSLDVQKHGDCANFMVITEEEERERIRIALIKQPLISQTISQRRGSAAFLTRLVREIQEIRRNSVISAESMSKVLGVTPRTLQSDFRLLKEAKFVRRIGSDFGGNWQINLPY